MAFKQIPLAQLPFGLALPVASIKFTPNVLEPLLNLKFERTRDDLDYLDGAGICSDTGIYFALIYHLNAPIAMNGIQIDILEQSPNPVQDRALALEYLAPAKAEILWLRPDLQAWPTEYARLMAERAKLKANQL